MTPEQRAAAAERMRRMNADPQRRAIRRAASRKGWTEERRRKMSEDSRARMLDPERRQRQADIMRAMRANPENEEKRQAACYTKEWRRAQAERMESQRADPAWEAKRHANHQSSIKVKANKPPIPGKQAGEIRLLRRRGGNIPAGYEDLYAELMKKNGMVAREALRLVRLQRGFDLRRCDTMSHMG